jgi:hypothetical protein
MPPKFLSAFFPADTLCVVTPRESQGACEQLVNTSSTKSGFRPEAAQQNKRLIRSRFVLCRRVRDSRRNFPGLI